MREPVAFCEFVWQCGALVEELFGVSLTEAEWNSLSEILTRASNDDSCFWSYGGG